MTYVASPTRYDKMTYNRVGNSGLILPAISLGLWNNFGDFDPWQKQREIVLGAFDMEILHFDLANNYGPTPGSAEKNFGRILKEDLASYRDEIIISSKAGYTMWPGPYGDWGSKKYLVASCDQSLKRIGVDYLDIFYHHRPDPNTPLEETAAALDLIVRQGKALYVGISNYRAPEASKMAQLLKAQGTPFVIHQPRYNMFDRWIEDGLTDVLAEEELGAIVFSPLAQGLLTNRYLHGIPEDSRANRSEIPFLKPDRVEQTIKTVKALNDIAESRDQTLAQMALAWNLRQKVVSSVLVGASRLTQLQDNVKALDHLEFSNDELAQIEVILADVQE